MFQIILCQNGFHSPRINQGMTSRKKKMEKAKRKTLIIGAFLCDERNDNEFHRLPLRKPLTIRRKLFGGDFTSIVRLSRSN